MGLKLGGAYDDSQRNDETSGNVGRAGANQVAGMP